MTTLAASLAARFSSFAIVAALTLSTVLATGCANGEALESSEEMDGTATAQVEQPGAATPQARKLGEAIPVPAGYVATAPSQLPGSFAKPELRKMGEAVRIPSGYVATAPHQLPGSVAKPELRKMGEAVRIPSGYVATTPNELPGTVAVAGPDEDLAATLDGEIELPNAPVEIDLAAACDRDGRWPTNN